MPNPRVSLRHDLLIPVNYVVSGQESSIGKRSWSKRRRKVIDFFSFKTHYVDYILVAL
jgi:hypothetical protein